MSEFERIKILPARSWTKEKLNEIRGFLDEYLKTPYGAMFLRPLQAQLLADACTYNGLIGAVGVGQGKTLVSFLLPVVLGSKKPLLFIPAALVNKTKHELSILKIHWKIPDIEIWSYEKLSAKDGEETLLKLNPDLIIADECHKFKDFKAARTRKFLRFMRENTNTMFCGLSGTLTRKSILDFWHLSFLALRQYSPVPIREEDARMWAMVLDSETIQRKNSTGAFLSRPSPGRLLEFCDKDEILKTNDKYNLARIGVNRRMACTPGFVISTKDTISCSLTIQYKNIDLPDKIQKYIQDMRSKFITPDGEELLCATDVWRHAKELQCGFYYRFDPPPPDIWLERRKVWRSFVRSVLLQEKPGLDSPLQVATSYKEHPKHLEWLEVRSMYDPEKHRKAVWIDDYLLNNATDWMHKYKGIVWVEHTAVGTRLQKISGYRYYGGGIDDSSDILIAAQKGDPIIASIKAHGTGKNLQNYNQSLVLSPPPSGDVWEQLIGRTHRYGQEADEVNFYIYNTCPEILECMGKARQDAQYIQYITGNEQKLLLATFYV